jgi:hypothetical protein
MLMAHLWRLAAVSVISTSVLLVTTPVVQASPAPKPSVPSTGGERAIVDRTETSTAYRLPNGTFATEFHSAPIRIRDADGSWADIDTRLVFDGSTVRPKAAKGNARFSAGGTDAPFARLHTESGELDLGWERPLPKPELDGNKAVYRGVAAGGAGDLVATALPTGFRFDVVLNRRPTGPVEVRIPVTANGLTVSEAANGRLTVKDSKTLIASTSKPALYDAASPQAAKPGEAAKPRATAREGQDHTGELSTTVENDRDGKTLVLKPSASYLADPATTYPVTIDPTVVLPLVTDSDVNSMFDYNNVSGPYMKVGTETSGEKGRAFLRFDTRGLKPVTNAVLKLANIDAPACGPQVSSGVQVRRLTNHWDADTQTWTPQPASTTEDAVTSTEGSQYGCGSGFMTWNVTPVVNKWAAGTPNHGLVLQSPTEAAETNFRVFPASENPDGLPGPVLEVTSNEVITPGEGDDPADPGPSPKDLWPGRAEPETGVWITSSIDLSSGGLLTTRSHSAGQRVDLTHPNESVLGPNWRFEPLDGLLGVRLKDYSSNGYLELKHTTGTGSDRYLPHASTPNTYVSDGESQSTIVKNADGTFIQTDASPGMTYTYSAVGTDLLITKFGTTADGFTVIEYDANGRVSRQAAPPTSTDDCTGGNTACAAAVYQYATTTTATSTVFGDVADQLKAVSYDASGATAPVTAATYAYDNLKRLRKVEDNRQLDGDPVKTWNYTYDSVGNITNLTQPGLGTWTLTYAATGKLSGATQTATIMSASCRYAADYMLYGRCSTKVDIQKGNSYQYRSPFWKGTPTGGSVYGITNDGCSGVPGNYPNWPVLVPNFKPGCDSHDYGYGLIRNRIQPQDSILHGLPVSRRGDVDAVFQAILKTRICAKLTSFRKERCNRLANTYYYGVRAAGWSAI